MSIKLMSQAWEQSDVGGSELLLLLALADFANDEGVCWPSTPQLAKKIRLSDRQTQRLIDKLANDGYVEIVDAGGGRSKHPVYKVKPAKGDKMTPNPEPERVTPVTQRVTSSTQKGDVDVTGIKPSIEPPIEPSRKKRATAAPSAPQPSQVMVFREIFHRNPTVHQAVVINDVVKDLDLWRRVCHEWNMAGYKPTNVEGMLDWYRNGGRTSTPFNRGNGVAPPPKQSKVAASMAAVDRVEAMMREQGLLV